jgi:hypothetical protein
MTNMKRARFERNIVVLLFVLVLVIFSLAERDSKKLNKLYSNVVESGKKIFNKESVASTPEN